MAYMISAFCDLHEIRCNTIFLQICYSFQVF